MFGFLKDKLKKAVGKFSKDVEKESVVEKKEVIVEESTVKEVPKTVKEPEAKKQGFFSRIFGKKETEEIIYEKEELIEELEKTEIVEEKPVVKEEPIDETPNVEKKKPEVKTEKKPIVKEEPIVEKKLEAKKPVVKEKHEKKHIIKEELEAKPVERPIITPVEEKIIDKEEPKPDLKSLKKNIPREEPEKKGFFTKITETFTKVQISNEKFEELFWELEVVLLENNVAVEVIDKIKSDMKKELMSGKVSRKAVDEIIVATLKNSIIDLFDVEQINLLKRAKSKKPFVIVVIGVNGSGKTTSIAKLTHLFQKNGLKVVLAASDTFRAAAIQQLEEHANRLNTKLIKHDYNSDPAAVAFDAIKYAEAKDMDVVIIDTAGRLHSNTNLMRELEKVVRVCRPDIKIFVGESITGNDCVEQAKEFDRTVGIDAIILAKADIDEKGGAAISVSYVTHKPILYLGTGQNYDDLKEFDPRLIIESLEL